MRRLRAAVALSVLLAALASCSSAPGLDHDLSGYVKDADTGDPIPGAAVTFRTDTLRTWDTTSGSDGLYRVLVDVDVPFGELSASKTGYVTASTTVYFDTDTRRVDLLLRKM